MDVVPHVGIGSVHLGMTREAVTPLVERDTDIQVEFRGSPPVVAFIQAPKDSGAMYAGIDLFEMAADDVIEEMVQLENLDPSVYCPGKGEYYFPALSMSLWRSCVSSVDGEQGYLFDCVSLHAAGYYSKETMAFIRETTGLPFVPEEDAEPGESGDRPHE